jgi:hypothetical protein
MSIGEAKSETADSFLRPAQVTRDDQGFRCQNISCIGQELIVLNLPSIRSLVGNGNGEQHFYL